MTNLQKQAKKTEFCQKILAIAMFEAEQNSMFPNTKISSVFDSLEYLEFVMRLSRDLGPISNDRAAMAETFNDLAEVYASTS